MSIPDSADTRTPTATPPAASPQGETPSTEPSPTAFAERMGSEYRARFSESQIAAHAALAAQLSPERLCCVAPFGRPDGSWEVVVAGYDYLGELGIICGLFSALGLSIREGAAFTAPEPAPATTETAADANPAPRRTGPRRRTAAGSAALRVPGRVIIDVFDVAAIDDVAPPPSWRAFAERLNGLLGLIRAGDLKAARDALVEDVCAVLRPRLAGRAPTLLPMRIELDNTTAPTETVVRISSADSPAFLFQLLTALSMRGINVRWVRIETRGGQVQDVLGVTDERLAKLDIQTHGEELKAAIALIKQFTLLLPLSPDPRMALRNFGAFLDDTLHRPDWAAELADLQDAQALPAVARLMGVSGFLWDDFLRFQHQHLLPLVTHSELLAARRSLDFLRADLRARLEAVPDGPDRLDKRTAVLNAWKDEEMFRIDMRHIVGKAAGFTEFSAEMSDLAQVAVATLFDLIRADRSAAHGLPRLPDGGPCRLCLTALGKAGGREMGCASDIELMLVYEGDGATDGGRPISNSEFAGALMTDLTARLSARREGIFEIDLRLRPYGDAGPLGVSIPAFTNYYRSAGLGPTLQRQALVRLRPVAGDADFGDEVVGLRDQVLYEGPPLDMATLLHLRHRAATELVAAGAINVKISRGGLADIEYTIQALQVKYGRRFPDVRAANTLEAVTALGGRGVLSPTLEWRLRDAYLFLRRVIDALRIVRGNAKDLCLPPRDSDEFAYLARRMGCSGDRAESVRSQLADELERTMETVGRLTGALIEREFPEAAKAEAKA